MFDGTVVDLDVVKLTKYDYRGCLWAFLAWPRVNLGYNTSDNRLLVYVMAHSCPLRQAIDLWPRIWYPGPFLHKLVFAYTQRRQNFLSCKWPDQ